MYYIEQIDGELIKYEVELDEERLIELKKIIINECGRIEHKSYDAPTGPNIFEALNKKYNINKELTLLFFDHNFIIYQSSNQQSIINFLRMKNF